MDAVHLKQKHHLPVNGEAATQADVDVLVVWVVEVQWPGFENALTLTC
jgi:hypothetical protein